MRPGKTCEAIARLNHWIAVNDDMTDTDTGTCPVCGREYVHKRVESSRGASLREDMVECRQPRPGQGLGRGQTGYTVYVHDGGGS